jgi:hypothetical protein
MSISIRHAEHTLIPYFYRISSGAKISQLLLKMLVLHVIPVAGYLISGIVFHLDCIVGALPSKYRKTLIAKAHLGTISA